MTKKTLRAALLLITAMCIPLLVNRTTAQPDAAGGNLIACPWFRQTVDGRGTFASVCGEWTRDNNITIWQADGVPSPDAMNGTASRFVRDTNGITEAKLWQVVESPGGLRLHFSMFHQVPAGRDLTVRIYGRDTRYGVGGWSLLWTPVNMQTGDNVWRLVDAQMTTERPYRFYMVEIVGHVPGDLGDVGATFTGVDFSVSGGAIYMPMVTR